ncbi:MAG: hypothetical protein ACRDQU_01540 [Pseudonocardiaceae bacterium]
MSYDTQLDRRVLLTVITALAAWFLVALGASLFGLLQAGPSSLPLPIGMALVVPLLLGGLGYADRIRNACSAVAVGVRGGVATL